MYKAILVTLLAVLPLEAFSQVPVVEAGTNRSRSNAPAAAAAGGNELIVNMYNQLEALQQEVQTLRGRVEEQDYQIKRMQTEQRDRYLDIDRRLSSSPQPDSGNTLSPAIAPNTPAAIPAPGPVATPPANAVPQNSNPGTIANTTPQVATPPSANPAATPSSVPQMDEQELYRTALNLLLEQSNYEESIQYFQAYITNYPQGRYLTNSYYWQGEAFILVERFNDARNVFNKIINEFPQDPKAAGAMLKLGIVYEEMGDTDQARRTWQEIAVRYPESTTEIREAANHLRGQ